MGEKGERKGVGRGNERAEVKASKIAYMVFYWPLICWNFTFRYKPPIVDERFSKKASLGISLKAATNGIKGFSLTISLLWSEAFVSKQYLIRYVALCSGIFIKLINFEIMFRGWQRIKRGSSKKGSNFEKRNHLGMLQPVIYFISLIRV